MTDLLQYPRISLKAIRDVAYESPDHIVPWGTSRNNSTNTRFNQKLYQLFSHVTEPLRVLDMGCSGGGFVRECINDGCLAVGLEGSDFSKKHRRAEWAVIPELLFTCDLTSDFDISIEHSSTQIEHLMFDVITCWEVIEHIAEADLPKVAENVKKHLLPSGLWLMSVSPNEEVINGVRLHQTVKQRSWWIAKFKNLGFEHLEEYTRFFNTQYIRGPKYGAPGSFHLVLSQDPEKAPKIPRFGFRARVYDHWLGSKPQRLMRRLINGD